MTVRPVHAASLGVAGALVAGLVLVPVSTASAVDADGPSFYAIAADSGSSDASGQAERRAANAERSATRTTAKAAIAKKTQILQVMDGIQVPGAEGVSVAAGPKQVVQATGLNIRAFTKTTGAIPAKGNKTLSAFFGCGRRHRDAASRRV